AATLRALSTRLELVSRRSRIVITMRFQYYQRVAVDLQQEYPVTLAIRRFSPNEVYTFLERWYASERTVAEPGRIYGDLIDRPALLDLCSNPLILAMYVANDQTRGDRSVVPDTRSAFYEVVLSELLIRRRSRQLDTAAREALLEQRE